MRENILQSLGCLQRRPEKARKCSAAQGPHSEVVPRALWRLVVKSCDECKGSFARGCEAKRWSHWTCSSLGTIFQPMRINSVPDVRCFCNNNKNVLRAQSMVWHFVRHPVFRYQPVSSYKLHDYEAYVWIILSKFQAHWAYKCYGSICISPAYLWHPLGRILRPSRADSTQFILTLKRCALHKTYETWHN